MPQFHRSEANKSRALSVDDTRDRIRVMIKQESTMVAKAGRSACSTKKDTWRRLMISWMSTIVDTFDLPNVIIPVSVYYLDAAVTGKLVQSPNDYRLASLTALQLAIKVYDTKIFPLKQLLSITHSELSTTEVSQMEQQIVRVLHWRLHPPTFDCFVQQYSTLLASLYGLPTNSRWIRLIEEKALEVSRSIVMQETLRPHRRSVLAYAAMILAMDQLLQGHEPGLIETFQHEMGRLLNTDHVVLIWEDIVSHLYPYMNTDGCVSTSDSHDDYDYGGTYKRDAIATIRGDMGASSLYHVVGAI